MLGCFPGESHHLDSHQQCMGVPISLHAHQLDIARVFFFFFYFSQPNRCVVLSHLYSTTLLMNDAEFLFLCLFVILMPSPVKYPLMSFARF